MLPAHGLDSGFSRHTLDKPGAVRRLRALTGCASTGILDRMTQPGNDARDDTAALLAAVGITVTTRARPRPGRGARPPKPAGPPERWAALREQLGMPAATGE
jgi:hypothetical protein